MITSRPGWLWPVDCLNSFSSAGVRRQSEVHAARSVTQQARKEHGSGGTGRHASPRTATRLPVETYFLKNADFSNHQAIIDQAMDLIQHDLAARFIAERDACWLKTLRPQSNTDNWFHEVRRRDFLTPSGSNNTSPAARIRNG